MPWERIEGYSSRKMVRARPGPGGKIICFLRDDMGSELGGEPTASVESLHSTPPDNELL